MMFKLVLIFIKCPLRVTVCTHNRDKSISGKENKVANLKSRMD